MEPVEINAGAWYLRALRDDDRVTDVPALRETGLLWDGPATDDAASSAFVRAAHAWWEDESKFVWAVCEPTTGELVALIGVSRSVAPLASGSVSTTVATLAAAHRTGYADALAVGSAAVTRFVEGALELTLSTPP